MEQGTGIEPAFTAWEAVVLPIYEPCIIEGIITKGHGKSNHFLSIDPPLRNPYFFLFAFLDEQMYNEYITYKQRDSNGRTREKI